LRDATEDTKNPEIGGNKLQGRDREGGQGGARGGGGFSRTDFGIHFFWVFTSQEDFFNKEG